MPEHSPFSLPVSLALDTARHQESGRFSGPMVKREDPRLELSIRLRAKNKATGSVTGEFMKEGGWDHCKYHDIDAFSVATPFDSLSRELIHDLPLNI
jgi:hypothetical protein